MASNHFMLENDMHLLHRQATKKTKTLIGVTPDNPDLLEELEQRSERYALKSAHGNTAELYDQFYRDHKLLLKLFVGLGVMPLVRSAPGRVTFNWNSREMYYAFCFYIFTSYLVLRVGYERLMILHTTEAFDEYIYAIIFILFLVPHFWIPFVGWGCANRVAEYKTMWGAFQVRFYRVTGNTLKFPQLNLLIVILFIGCVLLAVVFLFCLSRLLDGFLLRHTFAYFHIITMINMNASLLYINTKAIRISSHSLSDSFEQDMKKPLTAFMINQYRLLWLNLSEILQTLGNAYARTYSTYCLFMAINITIGAYGALSEILETGFSFKVLGLVVLTVYCAFLLFAVCDCAERATSVVAKGVTNTLLSANLKGADAQVRREIDHFMTAIELNPPVVNMQGYGLLNRQLLIATISQIAIYLIVLIQFKLSLIQEQEAKKLAKGKGQ